MLFSLFLCFSLSSLLPAIDRRTGGSPSRNPARHPHMPHRDRRHPVPTLPRAPPTPPRRPLLCRRYPGETRRPPRPCTSPGSVALARACASRLLRACTCASRGPGCRCPTRAGCGISGNLLVQPYTAVRRRSSPVGWRPMGKVARRAVAGRRQLWGEEGGVVRRGCSSEGRAAQQGCRVWAVERNATRGQSWRSRQGGL